MGTQNAWEGSGGRGWSRVESESENLFNEPSSTNAEAVLPLLSDALDWLGDGTNEAATTTEVPQGDSPRPSQLAPRGRHGRAAHESREEAEAGEERGEDEEAEEEAASADVVLQAAVRALAPQASADASFPPGLLTSAAMQRRFKVSASTLMSSARSRA